MTERIDSMHSWQLVSFGRIDNGLDGYLYGAPNSQSVDKINPATMTVVSTISLAPYFVDQVVADQAGDIYMSGQGYIREFTWDVAAETLISEQKMQKSSPGILSPRLI